MTGTPQAGSSGGGDGGDGGFANAWDRYVDDKQRDGQVWPGDDWGDRELWDRWFRRLLGDFGAGGWQRAVEVGQGTGKYTARVLAAGTREVLACDVSERFLALCRERLGEPAAQGRLHLARIDERDPDGVLGAARRQGWQGEVDAVYAIDTLVHLPFTQVAAVMLNAALVLREGGVLAFTFACGTSVPGLQKLVADLDRVIRAGSDPTTGCFHFVSPELVRAAAEAMGFAVAICDVDPCHGRDGHFVAHLQDRDRARACDALRRR